MSDLGIPADSAPPPKGRYVAGGRSYDSLKGSQMPLHLISDSIKGLMRFLLSLSTSW